jgi:hypothetical protein
MNTNQHEWLPLAASGMSELRAYSMRVFRAGHNQKMD